jgi:SOS response regulatory protein OraA/RecX
MKVTSRRYLAARGCWELRLEGGAAYWAEPELASKLAEELTPQDLQRLEETSSLLKARDFALRALGRREHFTKELREKLQRRETPPTVIARIIRELQRDGLQDDMRAARALIRDQQAKGLVGARKLASELVRRGMALEEARRLAAEASPAVVEGEMVCTFVERYGKAYVQKMQRELERTLADDEKVKKAGGAKGVEYKLKMKYLDKVRTKLIAAGFTSEAATNAARRIISGE